MRLIIKERKQDKKSGKYKLIIRESKTGLTGGSYEAQILPADFKELTDSAEHAEDVQTRAKALGAFDIAKAGKLQLTIDRDGKIVSHGGRARSLAAPPDQLLPIIITTDPGDLPWDQIPDTIHNQFGTGKTVNKHQAFKQIKKYSLDASLNVFRLIFKDAEGKEKFYAGTYSKSGLQNLKFNEGKDKERERPYKYVYVPVGEKLPNKSQDQQPPKFKVALFQQEDKLKYLELDRYDKEDFKILDFTELSANDLI